MFVAFLMPTQHKLVNVAVMLVLIPMPIKCTISNYLTNFFLHWFWGDTTIWGSVWDIGLKWPYTAHRAMVRSVSSYEWCMVLHGIFHYLALSCTILHYFALSCPILHYRALSCTILHYLALSCSILHYLALSCTILHSLALSCTILHYQHYLAVMSFCTH